uniref:Uncharacterized protein n=1 Tax=Aplanochytrium stocchinoi TaxID=215587 RepID=A0A7S3LLM4_9STRA|mmetsp:Transcript_573/g.704  ORF Transcript_573/g.704 Transcript_573/m.704 type:complete len:129 (+) Transcript_573:262-648(+)
MEAILNDLSERFERFVLVPARERIRPIRRGCEAVLHNVGVDIDSEYVELLLVGVLMGVAILIYKLFYGHITVFSILLLPFKLLAYVAFLPFKVFGSLIFGGSTKAAAAQMYNFSRSGCNVQILISDCP